MSFGGEFSFRLLFSVEGLAVGVGLELGKGDTGGAVRGAGAVGCLGGCCCCCGF